VDNQYQVGDLVPLQATFRDSTGTLANTTVTLTVRAPDGTVTTPTPTNPSAGVYRYDLAATQPGLWWYTFKGSGAVQTAERNSFHVEQDWITAAGPLSPRALVPLEAAREYVLGSVLDDSQDAKLVRGINAMSDAVWEFTQREWKPAVNVTRRFHYRGKGTLDLAPYDLVAPTLIQAYTDFPTGEALTLNPVTTTDFGDYELRPSHGMPPTGTYRWLSFNRYFVWFRPWASQQGGFDITITGDWGITSIPDAVQEAVLIAVKNRYVNPEGGASRTFGDLSVFEPVEPTAAGYQWRALPADSRALLTPYSDDVGMLVA
jgi:hypothetical protein